MQYYSLNELNQITRKIDKFCEFYNDFTRNDFKNNRGAYEFKPLWNGLFMTLFDLLLDGHPLVHHGNRKIEKFTYNDLLDLNEQLWSRALDFLPEPLIELYEENPVMRLPRLRKVIIDDIQKDLDYIKKCLRYYPSETLIEDYDKIKGCLKKLSSLCTPDLKREGLNRLAVSDGLLEKEPLGKIEQEGLWYKTSGKEDLEKQLVDDLKFLMDIKGNTVGKGMLKKTNVKYTPINSLEEIFNPGNDDFKKVVQVLFFSRAKGKYLSKKVKSIEKKLIY